MKLDINDDIVTEHVKMAQGIIERLANNSKQCKQWCITLVTAILAYATKEPSAFEIVYIPIFIFYFLDSYYLALERNIRKQESYFLWKVENNKDVEEELFLRGEIPADRATEFCETIPRSFSKICSTIKAAVSLSTMPFYVALLVFANILLVNS